MNNGNELLYTLEGQASRYIFLKELNEINIFVEDIEKEYQYEEIFQRLFKGEIKITSIFPVGGKSKLKERFLEFGEGQEHNNFYLADGDFDIFLHEDEMIVSDNFMYLKTYNIENYYIDENAIIDFAKGLLQKRKNEVKNIIKFDEWFAKIIEQSKVLFFYYCYIQKFHPEVKNVARGPSFFIDEKTGFERACAMERFKNELKYVNGIDLDNQTDKIDEIKNKYASIYDTSYFELICGKFLLYSLYLYIESKCDKKNMDYKIFEWDLLRNFDISKLDYIKEKIYRGLNKNVLCAANVV